MKKADIGMAKRFFKKQWNKEWASTTCNLNKSYAKIPVSAWC